jgi:hypothetical protein
MITRIAVVVAILAALPTPPAMGQAQVVPKDAIFTVAGYAGEAHLLQLNGKSYVEVETLARLTKGTLSFKDNRTILTLALSDLEVGVLQAKAPQSQARAGLSRVFIQAGIEEMSSIREWRLGIVSAVQTNIPVSEAWLSAQHRQVEKNLALASSAVSTDDDRSAYPLLSAEFNNMQKLSDLYLSLRTRSTAMSPDKFDSTPLEEQILNCARGFLAMMESREFLDQPTCH